MGEFVCNLIIPGAGKSGTSSLHELLNQHPQICMSSVKEPHFFALDEHFDRGVAWHNSLFLQDSDLLFYGESSTLYMPSAKAIARISEHLVRPKIIFVLREPIQRCISHYRWLYRLGYEARSPREAFKIDGYGLEPDRSYGGNYKSYLQFSNYSHYIPRWQTAFGDENVLLLRSDDLKNNYQSAMDACFRFLGLESHIVQQISSNLTDDIVRVVSPNWMQSFEKNSSARLRRFFRYGKIKKQILHYMTHDAPRDIDDDLKSWLQEQLADDIVFFKEIGNV